MGGRPRDAEPGLPEKGRVWLRGPRTFVTGGSCPCHSGWGRAGRARPGGRRWRGSCGARAGRAGGVGGAAVSWAGLTGAWATRPPAPPRPQTLVRARSPMSTACPVSHLEQTSWRSPEPGSREEQLEAIGPRKPELGARPALGASVSSSGNKQSQPRALRASPRPGRGLGPASLQLRPLPPRGRQPAPGTPIRPRARPPGTAREHRRVHSQAGHESASTRGAHTPHTGCLHPWPRPRRPSARGPRLARAGGLHFLTPGSATQRRGHNLPRTCAQGSWARGRV